LTAATVTSFRPTSDPSRREPPRQVWYELDEALALLADLEDARDPLIVANQLGLVVTVEHQIRILSHSLDSMTGRDDTTTEPLRASEAARRLGVPTRKILRLIYQHELRYVMVNGIAHIPADALEEYRARAR
jgi:excisionase family DNA binding protein